MGEKTKNDPAVEDQTNEQTTETTEETQQTSTDSDSLKSELLKMKRELEGAQKKLRDAEAAKLEASGNFKKLWEEERKRAEELEGKLFKNTEAFIATQKRDVVKDAFLKAGMRPDALKLTDSHAFDELEVEVESGRMKVHGVDTVVAKYKSDYPFMFSKDAPQVNAGGAGSGTRTTGQVLKLSEIAKLERTKPEEYRAALRQYLEQKNKQ